MHFAFATWANPSIALIKVTWSDGFPKGLIYYILQNGLFAIATYLRCNIFLFYPFFKGRLVMTKYKKHYVV